MTTLCDKCHKEIQLGDWPFCPHGQSSITVIGDDIPGGVEIRHGICHEDGTPKKYYTKSAMRQAAFEQGYFQGNDTPKINHKLIDHREQRNENKAKNLKEGRYS